MKIAVGSDHRGIAAKSRILALCKQLGNEAVDFGTDNPASMDCPDIAIPVATAVGDGKVDRGILICGTGIGMNIAANKVKGVRAAPCHDSITAELSRSHNDSNVLCLSADLLGKARAVVHQQLRRAQSQGRGRNLVHFGERCVRDGRLGP